MTKTPPNIVPVSDDFSFQISITRTFHSSLSDNVHVQQRQEKTSKLWLLTVSIITTTYAIQTFWPRLEECPERLNSKKSAVVNSKSTMIQFCKFKKSAGYTHKMG
jgi:hypothetical protein